MATVLWHVMPHSFWLRKGNFWLRKEPWDFPRPVPGQSQDAPFVTSFLCIPAVNMTCRHVNFLHWDCRLSQWAFILFFLFLFHLHITNAKNTICKISRPYRSSYMNGKGWKLGNFFFWKKGCVFNAMELKQETACFLRLKYNTID